MKVHWCDWDGDTVEAALSIGGESLRVTLHWDGGRGDWKTHSMPEYWLSRPNLLPDCPVEAASWTADIVAAVDKALRTP